MTPEIALLGLILIGALALFISGLLAVDLVALLVLVALAVTGLITPVEALAGFSSPAVVTVWAVFILSGGLSRTGVATFLGRQLLRFAGEGEARLICVVMLGAGALSAFMNNVAVAALLLPVVKNIAARTSISPARLLMPLAYGCLLGGTTTLIGTPPNILVADAQRGAGQIPFGFFDFAPTGVVMLLVGTVFMSGPGRRLLPKRRGAEAQGESLHELMEVYDLSESLRLVEIKVDSPFVGRRLSETHLGEGAGVTIVALLREERWIIDPSPTLRVAVSDRLVVQGATEWLESIQGHQSLLKGDSDIDSGRALEAGPVLVEVLLAPGSALEGRTLRQLQFRQRYRATVVAIRQDGAIRRTDLQDLALRPEARLLLQCGSDLEALGRDAAFSKVEAVSVQQAISGYQLAERLMVLRLPEGSALEGRSLAESRLGSYDLLLLGLQRRGKWVQSIDSELRLATGDVLLVEGRDEDLDVFQALAGLEVERTERGLRTALASHQQRLVEVVLSPHSKVTEASLRQLRFREKWGVSVLAILRSGELIRFGLADSSLRPGDALLVVGPSESVQLLAEDPDFIVLAEGAQEAARREKMPVAILIMVGFVLAAATGWLPAAIAAVGGAALMVLTRCLTMSEAHRYIEWPAVFLIAGLLPLGAAIESTGAAAWVTEIIVSGTSNWSGYLVIAALFLMTNLSTQIMPNPAALVLMAPIALRLATQLEIAPQPLLMTVAVGASVAVMSPIGHPANVMVMGPGGYRFVDYVKVGLPLTFVLLGGLLLVLPFAWPLV